MTSQDTEDGGMNVEEMEDIKRMIPGKPGVMCHEVP
jgi:hypothetical protein